MAIQYNNADLRRRNPVKRNSKFFSRDDFDLELNFGREYVEEDMNQTIILYQVDLNKTKVSDIYKEAKKDAIRFKPPIEIPVVYTIADAEVKSYDTKQMKGYYVNTGTLTFGVYIRTLEEFGCDISRGDYVGVQVNSEHIEFFTITDDGRVGSYSNKNTLYGTEPIIRNCTAVVVDKNEFNG